MENSKVEWSNFTRRDRGILAIYNKVVAPAVAALAREEKTECGCTQLGPCPVCHLATKRMSGVLRVHDFPCGRRSGCLTAEAHDCAVRLYAQYCAPQRA